MGNDILEIRAQVAGMIAAAQAMLAPLSAQPGSDGRAGKPRSATRLLRTYCTALSLAHAEALMLETDARAHGYSSTAALARRHREELVTLLAEIRELLPAAIKEESAPPGVKEQ